MSRRKKKTYSSPEESELDKLKLLAEHGGEFMQFGDIPAEVEQEFIKQIKKFQEKIKETKTESIYHILGEPVIKDVSGWKDEKIQVEIQHIIQKLAKKQILFEVITDLPPAELYRFITEKLYVHEIQNIRLKGWSTYLFYEDFEKSPENEMKLAAHTFFSSLISTEMPLEHELMEPYVMYQGKLMSKEEVTEETNHMKSFVQESRLIKLQIKYIECSDDRDFIDGLIWMELKKTNRSKRKTHQFGFQLHFKRTDEKITISEIQYHLPKGLFELS